MAAALALLPTAAWAQDKPQKPRASAVRPDEVKVHLTGAADLVLERRIEGTNLWESLCVGSCDTTVPFEGAYRVTGRGIRPSLPIALVSSSSSDVLHLDASPAYNVAVSGGIVTVIVGALAMFGGVTAAIADGGAQTEVAPCSFDSNCAPEPRGHALLIGGVATVLTGAVLVAGGIVAILLSGHTRTRQLASAGARGLSIAF